MNTFNGPEKRKHQRLEASYSVSYKINDSAEGYNLSMTGNISRGGILLMVNTLFPQGTILSLIIRCPFSLEPLRLSGEVLDSLEVVKDSVYKTRIKFLQVNQEQLARLDEFIKRINKSH